MDEDPPFTLMGFLGGLALGGVIAGCLVMAIFALYTAVVNPTGDASPQQDLGTFFASGDALPTLALPAVPPPRSGLGETPAPTKIPVTQTPAATPTSRSTSTPTSTIEPTPTLSPSETPLPTASPTATSSPAVATAVPSSPDLAVQEVTRLPGGTIRAVITNLGRGDLIGFPVSVIVADQTTRSELLQAGVGLRAGESVTVESRVFTVTAPMTVIVTVDPSQSVRDADRANNSISVLLGP